MLFIGLWMIADREGRLEYRPKRIKMQIFPADTIDVVPLIDGLIREDLIVPYEVGGTEYLWLPTFLKHQRPHVREQESQLPPCPQEKAQPRHDLGDAEEGARHGQDALNPECGILNPDVLNGDKPPVDNVDRGRPKYTAVDTPESLNYEAWQDYMQHRKELKAKRLTKRGESMAMNKLAKLPHGEQQSVVDLSISNGWTGLFPEKHKPAAKRKQSYAERLHAEMKEKGMVE